MELMLGLLRKWYCLTDSLLICSDLPDAKQVNCFFNRSFTSLRLIVVDVDIVFNAILTKLYICEMVDGGCPTFFQSFFSSSPYHPVFAARTEWYVKVRSTI